MLSAWSATPNAECLEPRALDDVEHKMTPTSFLALTWKIEMGAHVLRV